MNKDFAPHTEALALEELGFNCAFTWLIPRIEKQIRRLFLYKFFIFILII
jgi:hypothetical protein